jgi:hypothetical protein
MAYFAKIQPTEAIDLFIVSDVIAAEQSIIDSGEQGDPSTWIQTSYNTYGNVHYAPSPPAEPGTPDGGVALRGNYATIGCTYDQTNDVFYLSQPYPSWILNQATWIWDAPVPQPPPTGHGYYLWDEATLSWVYYQTS